MDQMIKKNGSEKTFPYVYTRQILDLFYPEYIEKRKVLFDIETTGLSRSENGIYLIGAAVWTDGEEDQNLNTIQWLCEKPEEESEILRAFFQFIQEGDLLIHYNGEAFDLPFIRSRSERYGIPAKTETVPALDLMKIIKPFRKFLPLINLKQVSLEAFLGSAGRNFPDGKRCIRLYREGCFSEVLGHNREDLSGLSACCSLLSFRQFREGSWQIRSLAAGDKEMCFTLVMSYPLCAALSIRRRDFYLSVHENLQEAAILISSVNGKYRHYYEDFINYDYIPSEDTAMPKSISSFLDRSLRHPAAPENCYTWFVCNDRFVKDTNLQLKYLKSLFICALHIPEEEKKPCSP